MTGLQSTQTFRTARGGELAYAERGSGAPLLALRGAYSTGHEIMTFLAGAVDGRPLHAVYPDLPGMGDSTGRGVETSDDVLDDLEQLVDARFGDAPMLVVGHSFGAHIARGLAARHPERIAGLALLCPLLPGELDPAPEVVVRADPDIEDELDADARAEFDGYFVVRTGATLARFREAVLPSIGRYDGPVVERIMAAMDLRVDPAQVVVSAPALIAGGRHDGVVGYRRQGELLGVYPRATTVVVADAGHALPHEQPVLVNALLNDLFDRSAIGGAPVPAEPPQ